MSRSSAKKMRVMRVMRMMRMIGVMRAMRATYPNVSGELPSTVRAWLQMFATCGELTAKCSKASPSKNYGSRIPDYGFFWKKSRLKKFIFLSNRFTVSGFPFFFQYRSSTD